jgi:AMP-binding enzyme
LLERGRLEAEVTVLERNRPDDTFGFGVVFSDATLGRIDAADPLISEALARHGRHRDRIEIRVKARESCGANGMAAVVTGAAALWETTCTSGPTAYGDAEAVTDGGIRLTCRELAEIADGLAVRLLGAGLAPGDNILVQLPNCWEFAVLTLACLRGRHRAGAGALCARLPTWRSPAIKPPNSCSPLANCR